MSFFLRLQPKQSEKEEMHVVSDEMASQISETIKTLPTDMGHKAFRDKEGSALFVNVMEYRCLFLKRKEVDASDLPIYGAPSEEAQDERSLEGREKEQVAQVLRETHWNLSKAAEVLGISRGTLYAKINRYGLKKEN